MFERLTIRTDICCEPENNIIYSNPNDPEGMYNILDLAQCAGNSPEEAGILLEISNRLAAYEDSCLTPEQVQELAKTKAEGRLEVLPVKVGDTVYVIVDTVDMPYVKQEKVIAVELWNKSGIMSLFVRTPYGLFDFGKTIFLTREEAEKAIGGGKE